MAGAIKIKGLKEFRTELKAMDGDLPKSLRIAGNEAAQIVVKSARPDVPSRSGRARRSVKASSTQSMARVSGGGTQVPYYPWLDFGGRVGRKNSVKRPFLKEGRYIWRAYADHREQVEKALRDALFRAAEQAGMRPS